MPKKAYLLFGVLLILASTCFADEIVTTKNGKKVILKNDMTWDYMTKSNKSISFKSIVSDFQRKRLPSNATAEYILRLKIYLDKSDDEMDSIMKKSFPNMRINGNETILDPSDSEFDYTPGKCRFISRVTFGDNPAVGFCSIHASLAKDLIALLKRDNFQPYAVGRAPKGTYIFRGNGYSIMFKYNDLYDMWQFVISRL